MKVYAYLFEHNRTPENKVTAWDIQRLRKKDPAQYEGREYYSTHYRAQDVQKLTHVNGKISTYFKYKSTSNLVGKGINESLMHDTVKNALSIMEEFNFIASGIPIKIFADTVEMEHSETLDGKTYRNDVFITFSKSDPPEYVENWRGKLAVEVIVNHNVEKDKLAAFKKHRIAMISITFQKTNKLYISDNCSETDFLNKEKHIKNSFAIKVSGLLLSNPISELNELRIKTSKLATENRLLKTQLDECVAEKSDLASKLITANRETEALSEYCKVLESNEDFYNQQIEQLKKSNNTLSNEFTKLKNEFTTLNIELNDLKTYKIIKLLQWHRKIRK